MMLLILSEKLSYLDVLICQSQCLVKSWERPARIFAHSSLQEKVMQNKNTVIQRNWEANGFLQ
jgi:hypothetical protein